MRLKHLFLLIISPIILVVASWLTTPEYGNAWPLFLALVTGTAILYFGTRPFRNAVWNNEDSPLYPLKRYFESGTNARVAIAKRSFQRHTKKTKGYIPRTK